MVNVLFKLLFKTVQNLMLLNKNSGDRLCNGADWRFHKLAGPPGVEPGKAVLETAVIPFHHRPK